MIGPRDVGWEEVVGSAAVIAATWAQRQGFGLYSDLARAVNEEVDGAALEPYGHPMNRLLYDIVVTVHWFEPTGPTQAQWLSRLENAWTRSASRVGSWEPRQPTHEFSSAT